MPRTLGRGIKAQNPHKWKGSVFPNACFCGGNIFPNFPNWKNNRFRDSKTPIYGHIGFAYFSREIRLRDTFGKMESVLQGLCGKMYKHHKMDGITFFVLLRDAPAFHVLYFRYFLV